MAFLTKDQLRVALTSFHETVVTSKEYLGGASVLLRELTAFQRMMATEAAQGENGETPNNYLYRAMLLQMMIADPETGTPYIDGRRHPETNEPRIDPRTRTPLFTADEIFDLMEGREKLVDLLLAQGLELSKLLPDDFRSGDQAADTRQRNAGPSIETPGTERREDADGQGIATNGRAPHNSDDAEDVGEELGRPAISVE